LVYPIHPQRSARIVRRRSRDAAIRARKKELCKGGFIRLGRVHQTDVCATDYTEENPVLAGNGVLQNEHGFRTPALPTARPCLFGTLNLPRGSWAARTPQCPSCPVAPELLQPLGKPSATLSSVPTGVDVRHCLDRLASTSPSGIERRLTRHQAGYESQRR
jgi:hypothetical protein